MVREPGERRARRRAARVRRRPARSGHAARRGRGRAPDELYHLAAPTFVPDSWEDPTETVAAIAGATATLLAAARDGRPARCACGSRPRARSSATRARARRPSAARCARARPTAWRSSPPTASSGAMRERFGLFACSGITYNHESPRRPEHFLPRKVTRGAAAIKLGLERELVLGDLRRGARLVARRRRRARGVAGAAGRRARRLRHRVGRRAHRARPRRRGLRGRRPGLGAARARRPGLRAPARAGAARRRPDARPRAAGLGAGALASRSSSPRWCRPTWRRLRR